nr:AF4/FMR2 family member 4-like isoform X2 [Procambarus clarkii]
MYNSHSMSSRERSSVKDRERLKQRAREMREHQAAVGLQEREPQPVVFDVVRRSPNMTGITDNNVERILGKYDNFARCGGSKMSMVGVDQQPPTPRPLHDPDLHLKPPSQVPGPGSGSSSSSKSSQRPLPPPQSSPNGTTRPPKPLPSSIKPPHPPSNHAHTKNGEVKGNLKGGPGPGPGDGGGGGRKVTTPQGKAALPPIKVDGGAAPVDKTIQQIMYEMSMKNPVSAIVQTPRHDHEGAFSFSAAHKDGKMARSTPLAPDRLGKGLDMSLLKQPKALDGSHVNDELILSEDSDDDETRVSDTTNSRPVSSSAQFGTPASHLQSSIGPPTNSIPPLSPISPKTSEESSSSDDTSDSDVSSNSASDDEQPECSPTPQENKSKSSWTLDNFIQPRKTSSPLSQGTPAGGPGLRPESNPPIEATVPAPTSREKRDRRISKPPAAFNSSVRGARAVVDVRGRGKPEKVGHYDDSSDDGEPHPRPTPRVSAELRQTPKHGRDHDSRVRSSKTKTSSNHPVCSDSDSDLEPIFSRKPGATQPSNGSVSVGKGIPKVSEKPPKTSVLQMYRESAKKPPRKRSDSSKKDSHIGAKSETGKSKRVTTSMEFVPSDIDSDSDSDRIIDVESTSPEKMPSRVAPSSRCTPSRTPKESSKVAPSPVKTVQASPHVSPMTSVSVSNKTSVKRPSGGLSEAISLESLTSKSEDEMHSPCRGQSSSQKVDIVRDKGALVNRAFSTSVKKTKGGRERDPVEKNKKAKTVCDPRKVSGSNKDMSEKSDRERSRGISESSSVDSRLEGRPITSPVVNKLCKSPIVSAEPKVPIPQVQYENGVPKLTCTIPLSFIDKVPKSSVNGALCLIKTEIKEEADKKKVLDNRTKEGKGKRKTCDPNSKAPEDVSKRKIITSIFGGVKRLDHESDEDKVKKEVKKETIDSDAEYEKTGIKSSITVKEEPDETPMGRPVGVRQRNVSASPMSPVSSDTSSSRQHRKKKKDRQAEKSPSSHERKRAKSNSERQPLEHPSLTAAGSNSCDDCDLQRSRRGGSVDSEKCTSSRKRAHERDSSLESTRSSSRANSESGEKRSKKPKVSKGKDPPEAAMSSPSMRSASQRTADDSQYVRTQEKEDSWQLKYPQRPQHSQQSSQYSQKGYSGVSEDAGVNQESEFGEEEDGAAGGSQSSHQRFYNKEKGEESGTTPSADSSGYASRPASEHESRFGSASFRSSGDQAKSSDLVGTDSSSSSAQMDNGTPMVAPLTQRQSASTTTSSSGSATSTPAAARASSEQSLLHGQYANPQERLYTSYFEKRLRKIDRDYMGYLNTAKQLKHIADGETDRSMQAMKYLEAALYFILSGEAMEADHDASASLTMYKDTLNFIKWVSSVFRRENQEGSLNSKLAVISLRCQSLLSLKIYKMRRNEHKENQRQLNRYFQNYNKTGGVETGGSSSQQWGGQRATGSPSHLSQTPSPAGSVGSEGSQSSGYTTSTEGTRSKGGIVAPPVGHTPPHPQPPQGAHATVPVVPVPVHIHALIIKQNQLSSHLASAHDMWIEADHYVSQNGMQDFFIELNRQVSPLTLHSSLFELVCYVQYGLHRLRD